MDALTAGRLSADRSAHEAWVGAVSSETTAALRARLYELLEAPGGTSLRLDVRNVTSIDRAGIAVLVGVRRKAANAGRTLVLIDSGGPVSDALNRMHLAPAFMVTQLVPA